MAKALRLRVLTPGRTVLDEEIEFLVLRAVGGEMGILPGHEPCAVRLEPGAMQVYENHRPVSALAVVGGFATVQDNEVVVMTPVAERPEELEAVLKRMEAERAESRRNEQLADFEMQRMEIALRRALVKMEVSTFSVLKGKDVQE